MVQDRHVVLVDYFINNDIEYLRGRSSSKKYMTSTTKTKAVKYDIPGIEDIWYDYGYLKEIEVRREDQQLYKFKEGDFPRLRMHDIEYMLLLLVQKKLFNLERDFIFYLDKYKRNRLMRSNELYKFSGGTLTSVRSVLHDIASYLRMDYLPNRRWSNLYRQRSRIMIKAINKLMLERRLMRSLEKFVGGREYGEDFRLLERTI
nr:hypothetical protein [Tanacetum cinerariifolium]